MAVETVPHRVMVPVKTLAVRVVGGPDAGRVEQATAATISVGTAPDNGLVLSDETVSRYHLELEHSGDQIVVRDLGSTNGTLAGSIWLREASLPSGTIVSVGKTQLRVEDGRVEDRELLQNDSLAGMVGRSASMRALMARITRVAKSDASVLCVGETGVGKEVVARTIHLASNRATGPFEAVDCAALTPTLVASELFGHERGAFTGADAQRIGAFERAHGGTIFLDEIGELPQNLQAALLGALERRSFHRVGGHEPINVDVRVVCATNRDLRREVNSKVFREDLYYRIAVVVLGIPPLRERAEDIPLLVAHFLRDAGHAGSEEVFTERVLEELGKYRWPGNVRELRNFVEASLALGEMSSLGDDPGEPTGEVFGGGAQSLLTKPFKSARASVVAAFERLYLGELLDRCGGNVSEAARESGIHRSYIDQMLRRRGLR